MNKAKAKKTPAWNTSSSPFGSGDYYGTGIKQKVGTIQRDYLNGNVSSKKMNKPPKSLA